jgi:hypothetical protein
MRNKLLALALCSLGWQAFGSAAAGADNAAVLAPYVNDDSFVAAYLDLTALPKTDVNENDQLFAVLPQLGEDAQAWILALKGAGDSVERLRGAGVNAIYVIAGLGDVNLRGGPLMIFHVGGAGRPENVAQLLNDLRRDVSSDAAATQLVNWLRAAQVRVHGIEAVLVGAPATLDRYASLAKRSRADLMGPLDKLASEGAVVAIVFCPGPDFRRVVRELWPELPFPFAPLKGELADRWLHAEFAANASPQFNPRFVLQAADDQSAELFADLMRKLPTSVAALMHSAQGAQQAGADLIAILQTLRTQREGARVAVTVPVDQTQLTKLQSGISDAIYRSLESSRRAKRFNQFKQLTIGMQNYADVNKHLPPAAICDADGRALLSWRVAILPFIDETGLYKQFHLDEPWNSRHNRTLIEKMPAIYADPDPKLSQLAREGKTTYQVPVGPETIFHKSAGTSFREISDGTSRTITLVEVEPPQAAVWTQPEDWNVDLQNPLRGVERTDRPIFIAGFADCHVSAIPVTVDPAKLRAQLTRAGGEEIE